MRTARAGLVIASLALAATACGGSGKAPAATGASTPPPASAAAPTSDAAPTPAADSPTPDATDTPTADASDTDGVASPTDGDTGPTDTDSPAATSTDPTLLALSDLPAGFTVIPPDVTKVGEPGICGVAFDGAPGSTGIQRVSFHSGSGATEVQVSEHYTQYPDAATATAAYSKEVKEVGCGTYTDSATGTTTVAVSKDSDTEMQLDITGTVSGTSIEAKGVVLVVGDKVYSGGLTAVAPADGSLVTTVVTTVEHKAGA